MKLNILLAFYVSAKYSHKKKVYSGIKMYRVKQEHETKEHTFLPGFQSRLFVSLKKLTFVQYSLHTSLRKHVLIDNLPSAKDDNLNLIMSRGISSFQTHKTVIKK